MNFNNSKYVEFHPSPGSSASLTVRRTFEACAFVILLNVSLDAAAQQEGKRVYQKDSIGNIQYHKQSWVIKDGKMCPVDTIGNRQYDKPCIEVGSAEVKKTPKAGKKD